jgi:voltage-gated potassium channel
MLILSVFIQFPIEVNRALIFIDTVICGFFLLEFSINFYKAESKLQYMKWGWIDLLASIPFLDSFRAARAFRLIKLLRILRALKSFKIIYENLFQSRTKGTFSSALILAVILLLFSSIAILQVEDVLESNIKTAEDAIWWSFVTITTVGYGDKYPVTTEGRFIAATLMTAGVGLFGIFTGFVASWFMEEKK